MEDQIKTKNSLSAELLDFYQLEKKINDACSCELIVDNIVGIECDGFNSFQSVNNYVVINFKSLFLQLLVVVRSIK